MRRLGGAEGLDDGHDDADRWAVGGDVGRAAGVVDAGGVGGAGGVGDAEGVVGVASVDAVAVSAVALGLLVAETDDGRQLDLGGASAEPSSSATAFPTADTKSQDGGVA